MESQYQTNYFLILIIGTMGMLLLTTAIAVFVYLYQRKLIKRKIAYKEIEDLLRKQELQSAYSLLKGQENERKRIARELHDNLGSILVTLNLFSDTLQSTNDPNKKQEMARKISDMALKANEATRTISHHLLTGSLIHFGLTTALNELVSAIQGINSTRVHSSIDITSELATEVTLNIYRIIQELINNTLKHAHAKKINLEVTEVNKEYLSIIYSDDGIGMDSKPKATEGIGLTNIRTRIDKLNGTLDLETTKQKGTTFIIEIPITPIEDENDQSITG